MTTRWRRLTRSVPTLPLTETALGTTATGAGAVVYGGFFATTDYLPVLGLGCLMGAMTAAVAAARRWNALSTLLVACGGFALYATYAVFGDTVEDGLPTSRTGSDLLHGVVGGWVRMLTVQPPADTWNELLVTPVLVVWCAAFAAVTLTVRTRSLLAPVGPPLAAFVLALLAVGNQPGEHTPATVTFLTATLFLLLARSHRTVTDHGPPSSRKPRPFRSGGVTIVLSALVGIAVGQALPLADGQHRFEPRDLLPAPIAFTDTLTPLAKLKPQLTEDPPRTLFTVRMDVDEAALVTQVRTAALDAFDGTTWTTSDTYRTAGSHLAPDPAVTDARSVAARVEVADLDGPFLPVLGRPTLISGPHPGDVGFDPRSGVVVSTAPTLRGLRYDLNGDVTIPDDGLVSAVPSTSPAFERYRTLPADVPPVLPMVALREAANGRTPYAKLTALEQYFHILPCSLRAPPGHSYAALARVLTGLAQEDYNEGTGYAEQFAAAFAVLARMLGYPTRVAVGYRLRGYHDGRFMVTTADAHAWPEVHFTGYGWVSFEPTDPMFSDDPPPPEIPFVAPPRPDPPPIAPPAPQPPTAATHARPGLDWAGVLGGTASVVAGLAALFACTAAMITAEKARRRRKRRRAPSPAARVLGAWHELIDRLAEQGITLPVSMTAQEVAEHATAALGAATTSIQAMAPLVTAAVFEPDQPHHDAADRAWQLVGRLRAELYPRRVSLRHLRAAVHPRPLWTRGRAAQQRRRALSHLEMGTYR